MEAYFEVWGPEGARLTPIEAERVTIGRASSNDVRLNADQQVSRLHAVVERYAAGWSIRDVGSSNGTYVNGERLLTEHRLRNGDELRIGTTRVVFREQETEVVERTLSAGDEAPDITKREKDVLRALCRPIVSAESFAQPASIRQMAAELVVSEAAIKFHLSNLYDKFDIFETGLSRRAELANEAVRRGAVTMAELRHWLPVTDGNGQ